MISPPLMRRLTMAKSQIPNPKPQRSSKFQIPKDGQYPRLLELGFWDFFGGWEWGFGISFLPHIANGIAEPAGRDDFLLRVKLHAFLPLDVEIAVKGFAPAGKRKHRHGRGHANVDPDHSCFDAVFEFAPSFAGVGENRGAVAVSTLVCGFDCGVEIVHPHDVEHRAEHFFARAGEAGAEVGLAALPHVAGIDQAAALSLCCSLVFLASAG